MWPDVGNKSNPKFPIVARQVTIAVFSENVVYYKIGQKVATYLDSFVKKMFCLEPVKISQSGHTAYERSKFWECF